MGKALWLTISYNERTDEFFSYVDDGTEEGHMIYQINDTEEMCDLIETGVMKHIDDAQGLSVFLMKQGFIEIMDTIKVNPELLW